MQTRDYELRWPVDVFREHVVSLLNSRNVSKDWDDRAEQLLRDAFVTGTPLSDFTARLEDQSPPSGSASLTGAQKFLRDLVTEADDLPMQRGRRAYWSERLLGGPAMTSYTLDAAMKAFFRAVDDLDARGYFDRVLGPDCVDNARDVSFDEWLAQETGHGQIGVSEFARLGDPTPLLDAMEAVHDIAALPVRAWYHAFDNCGWHGLEWSADAGQRIYRWQANQILSRTELGLQLADEGEDEGRLVYGTDEARTALVAGMSARENTTMTDEVAHAIALFRSRGAGVTEKRSAVVSLAGVLENRRSLVREHLLRKDEAALFTIANEFDLRHRKPDQRGDYDEAFLDWIFYWYLATIELSDRIFARRPT